MKQEDERNILYKITCEDSESVSTGQSRRMWKQSTGEHMRSVNSKAENILMYKHALEMIGHELIFTQVKVLATETWDNTRKITEALHSNLNKKSLNKTWEVPKCYKGILEKPSTVTITINFYFTLEETHKNMNYFSTMNYLGSRFIIILAIFCIKYNVCR